MIYAEKGKEQECFIDFVEKALGILAFVYSYLYFQCPLDIEWSTVYQFMEYVNSKLMIHYASAGYEMAFNDLCPKSAGYGVRAFNQLNYVNSEYTEWNGLHLSTRFGVPFVPPERSMLMKKEDWVKRLKRFEEIQS